MSNLSRVSFTALVGIPLIEPGDDLVQVIIDNLESSGEHLINGDVLVLAQKIVSKAENRYVSLRDIEPSENARELAGKTGKDPRHVEVVLRESREVLRYRQNVLVVEDCRGFVMANAGIDESNISHDEHDDRILLLPEDPDASARRIKVRLDAYFGIQIGVIISDSFGRAWRFGVVGIALGAAGVPSLVSLIGSPDLFGRPMRITEVAIADEIAAGAALVIGEAAEGRPIALVRGVSLTAPEAPVSRLLRPREQDLFR